MLILTWCGPVMCVICKLELRNGFQLTIVERALLRTTEEVVPCMDHLIDSSRTWDQLPHWELCYLLNPWHMQPYARRFVFVARCCCTEHRISLDCMSVLCFGHQMHQCDSSRTVPPHHVRSCYVRIFWIHADESQQATLGKLEHAKARNFLRLCAMPYRSP